MVNFGFREPKGFLFRKKSVRKQFEGNFMKVATNRVYIKTRNIFKKIYDEGYISRLFSKIIMVSNHIAFALLLFSSANFITDSNKYIIASKTSRKTLISTCLENIQHCKHMHYVPCQRQVYNFPECTNNNDM